MSGVRIVEYIAKRAVIGNLNAASPLVVQMLTAVNVLNRKALVIALWGIDALVDMGAILVTPIAPLLEAVDTCLVRACEKIKAASRARVVARVLALHAI